MIPAPHERDLGEEDFMPTIAFRLVLLAPVVGARVIASCQQAQSFGEGAKTIVPSEQTTRPVRVHGGLLYGPGVGLYVESAGLMVSDPVTATIEEGAEKWAMLNDLLVMHGVTNPGAEAANKLISSASGARTPAQCSLRRMAMQLVD